MAGLSLVSLGSLVDAEIQPQYAIFASYLLLNRKKVIKVGFDKAYTKGTGTSFEAYVFRSVAFCYFKELICIFKTSYFDIEYQER